MFDRSADPAGFPNITYYRSVPAGPDALMRSRKVNGGGNCGPGDTWICGPLDKMGASPHPMGVSLALEEGWVLPFYAYQDASDAPDPAALKVWEFILNWKVDPGSPCTDEARFVSADYATGGLATIAYYEWDKCLGTGRLKVAWLRWKVLLPILRSGLP